MRGEERELKEIVGVGILRNGFNSRTPFHPVQQKPVMSDSHGGESPMPAAVPRARTWCPFMGR
jgi:hypothetical protein